MFADIGAATKDRMMQDLSRSEEPVVQTVSANGIQVEVATMGEGPVMLLIHGWPHTWRLWEPMMRALASTHRLVAPDLRGTGGSSRTFEGYDAATLADDAAGVLDAIGVGSAMVVGIDAGVIPAAMLAIRSPHRVDRLALMEGLLGRLPGAEAFLSNGAPWWFGFHATRGLPETVLVGHEGDYIDWFLTTGTSGERGIDADTRDAFVHAYSGMTSLRCGFEHYRALPANGEAIATLLTAAPFAMPTLAIEGGSVGDAISRQLARVSDDFRRAKVEHCKHLIPLEQPAALAAVLRSFGDNLTVSS